MAYKAYNVALAQQIPDPRPYVVGTIDADAFDFLATLPVADLSRVQPEKALWAVQADGLGGSSLATTRGAHEGSVFPSTGGTASTWICSSEAYRYLKAFRA